MEELDQLVESLYEGSPILDVKQNNFFEMQASLEKAFMKQLYLLQCWSPYLDRLTPTKQKALFQICRAIPSFTLPFPRSFANLFEKWSRKFSLSSYYSIAVLYASILYLQSEGLLPELPQSDLFPLPETFPLPKKNRRTAKRKQPPLPSPEIPKPLPTPTPSPSSLSTYRTAQCPSCQLWLCFPWGAEVIRCSQCNALSFSSFSPPPSSPSSNFFPSSYPSDTPILPSIPSHSSFRLPFSSPSHSPSFSPSSSSPFSSRSTSQYSSPPLLSRSPSSQHSYPHLPPLPHTSQGPPSALSFPPMLSNANEPFRFQQRHEIPPLFQERKPLFHNSNM